MFFKINYENASIHVVLNDFYYVFEKVYGLRTMNFLNVERNLLAIHETPRSQEIT
jgi:hypothetical protein